MKVEFVKDWETHFRTFKKGEVVSTFSGGDLQTVLDGGFAKPFVEKKQSAQSGKKATAKKQ